MAAMEAGSWSQGENVVEGGNDMIGNIRAWQLALALWIMQRLGFCEDRVMLEIG